LSSKPYLVQNSSAVEYYKTNKLTVWGEVSTRTHIDTSPQKVIDRSRCILQWFVNVILKVVLRMIVLCGTPVVVDVSGSAEEMNFF
jgi:hypothetical protein